MLSQNVGKESHDGDKWVIICNHLNFTFLDTKISFGHVTKKVEPLPILINFLESIKYSQTKVMVILASSIGS
jgi:hypothetical protein